MILWSIIGLLLIGTLAALLYPLYKGRNTLETRDVFDANVFKDQLTAIDRERDEGQISTEDAESARVEISRKLLAAADKAEQQPSIEAQGRQLSRLFTFGIGLAVPLFAVGLYLNFGSPEHQDQPLEARLNTPSGPSDKVAQIFAYAEKKLVEKPGDGGLWEIMAGLYLKRGMYAKAENAYQNTIRLLGPTGDRLSNLADAMVLANDNIVGDNVVPVLKRAIKADPNHPKPRFWMALYFEQNNKFKQAEGLYTTLLQNSGAEEAWRPTVTDRLNEVRKKQGLPPTRIAGQQTIKIPQIKLGNALKKEDQKVAGNSSGGQMSGPSAEDIKQASRMSATDRKAMINNMVSRLSTRLYDEGGDIKSWMRLVTVLNVQGKTQEAQKAVQAGKKNLANNKQAVTQLDTLAKKLGLGS